MWGQSDPREAARETTDVVVSLPASSAAGGALRSKKAPDGGVGGSCIAQLATKVRDLEHYKAALGTSRDTMDLRKKSKEKREQAQQLARSISSRMKKPSGGDGNPASQRKLQADFERVLRHLQVVLEEISEKERQFDCKRVVAQGTVARNDASNSRPTQDSAAGSDSQIAGLDKSH